MTYNFIIVGEGSSGCVPANGRIIKSILPAVLWKYPKAIFDASEWKQLPSELLSTCGGIKPDNYIITGRIRDEKNLAAEGYIVQALNKDPKIYLKPDDRLGSAITDKDG